MSHFDAAKPKSAAAFTHKLGVVCALAAGVWLGGAEAPTKLVNIGISPFAISLAMVLGVFVARWTLPTLLKGTDFVFHDLFTRPHLIIWAVLAGALWAVANTLTVFAIRDVGLSIAFPLWNANSLVGIFWGWLLFQEMRGAGFRTVTRVLGGAFIIVIAATLLGYVTVQHNHSPHAQALHGVAAALGASLLWGTMYVPYRKAYISGMNPLSFVTVFTLGEVGTMALLAVAFGGGAAQLHRELSAARHAIFWIFLGGFCWVIGDLFQQYATKYIGIGRGIPLSNTNQLWGLAWGALVFGELDHVSTPDRWLVLLGSVMMILGAMFISTAVAPAREQDSGRDAISRECEKYGLSFEQCIATQLGHAHGQQKGRRPWWDLLIVAAAIAVFLWLGLKVQIPSLDMNFFWMGVLGAILLFAALSCGWLLWKHTRFS
ncbi:GRP family sugar transporter [Pseudacidobacterium ailaaui]|uniref:GRP family sugar transporter n=1 Tax=Pseudacidobacterium ailaaui TaxID=1382359 RepID=UPI0005D17028|nr:GRP family sugar transporter [Pseudacidobacterium ailaaui]